MKIVIASYLAIVLSFVLGSAAVVNAQGPPSHAATPLNDLEVDIAIAFAPAPGHDSCPPDQEDILNTLTEEALRATGFETLADGVPGMNVYRRDDHAHDDGHGRELSGASCIDDMCYGLCMSLIYMYCVCCPATCGCNRRRKNMRRVLTGVNPVDFPGLRAQMEIRLKEALLEKIVDTQELTCVSWEDLRFYLEPAAAHN